MESEDVVCYVPDFEPFADMFIFIVFVLDLPHQDVKYSSYAFVVESSKKAFVGGREGPCFAAVKCNAEDTRDAEVLFHFLVECVCRGRDGQVNAFCTILH